MNNFMSSFNQDSLSFSDKSFIRQENDRMLMNRRTGLQSYNNYPHRIATNFAPPKIEYIDYYKIISELDDHELLVVKNIKHACKDSLDFTFTRTKLFKNSDIKTMTANEILRKFENKFKFLEKKDEVRTDVEMYYVKSYAIIIDKYNLVIKNRKNEEWNKLFSNLFWKMLIPVLMAIITYWTMQSVFPPVA